ncbi:hypothetical protein D9M73_115280 [compost metagenome]
MAFHIFRHVETLKRDAHDLRELLGDFGLPDAGWAGEQIVADRFFRIAQASPAELDRRGELLDRGILPEHHALEIGLERFERLRIVGRDRFRRDARHRRDHGLDFTRGDGLLALGERHQHLHRADFVDHVDRLIGQLPVVDVTRGQFHRRLDRVGGVFDLVMLLERRTQPGQDLDGILDRRLVDVDLLEAPQQRAVLLEMVAELLIRRRTDAADRPARQSRLEQVGRIHRAAAGGTSADHGVDLIDKQDRVRQLFKLVDDGLQPLLKITAIARAGEQRAHVERIDDRGQQHLGHFALDDLARQPLGNRGLAHAGIAHIKRVVLGTAAQDLHGAIDLGPAPDQRIDLALLGLLVEIDAELLERAFALALFALLWRFFLIDALWRGGFRCRCALADAVADEADRIETAHILLLQEIDGVAFALAEQGDQHIRAGHFIAAGGLHMQDRALDDALEARGGRGVGGGIDLQRLKFGIEIMFDGRSQLSGVHAAGLHHLRRMFVVDQGEQQMLERGIFVPARRRSL